MVATLTAIVGAIVVTAVLVAAHLSPGVAWRAREDLADDILEHRASTFVEPDYPTPMSRAPGAGGPTAAGVPAGESEGELAEGATDEAAEEGPWTVADDDAEVYEIEYAKEGETIAVPENQTLLEAGEEQGWDLPYACREGQCLSCGGHVVNGPAADFVTHNNQQMLEAPELDDGYVLTCCAYPQGEFTLETGETP